MDTKFEFIDDIVSQTHINYLHHDPFYK